MNKWMIWGAKNHYFWVDTHISTNQILNPKVLCSAPRCPQEYSLPTKSPPFVGPLVVEPTHLKKYARGIGSSHQVRVKIKIKAWKSPPSFVEGRKALDVTL